MDLPLITLALAILAFVLSAFAVAQMISLQKVRKIFFSGKDASTLEEFIIGQNKKINELVKQTAFLEEALYQLQDKQKLAIQKMGLVRYNSYADNGGNLSFSMAILDAKDNGVVITSMYGREHSRIYTKPIVAGKSEVSLTEEEKKAISTSKVIKEFINKNN